MLVFLDRNSGLQTGDNHFGLIWKSFAPLKAIAMTWWSFWDRLPIKANLIQQEVISSEENATCVYCKLEAKSATHFFIYCNMMNSIWGDICNQCNVSDATRRHLWVQSIFRYSRFWNKIGVQCLNFVAWVGYLKMQDIWIKRLEYEEY